MLHQVIRALGGSTNSNYHTVLQERLINIILQFHTLPPAPRKKGQNQRKVQTQRQICLQAKYTGANC